MAGYDGYSRSNNAIIAEEEGKYPASKFASIVKKHKKYKGCTASDVSAVLLIDEWHHTSCRYNRTNFYTLTDLLEINNRNKLAIEIANRKEFTRLLKKAQQAGITHTLTDTGEEWFPLPKKWRGLYGTEQSTLDYLRSLQL